MNKLEKKKYFSHFKTVIKQTNGRKTWPKPHENRENEGLQRLQNEKN
jgi:hypothetical protein